MIGRALPLARRRRWAVVVSVVFLVACAPTVQRWYSSHAEHDLPAWLPFAVLSALSVLVVAAACGWDRESLGWRLPPEPGWGFWVRVGIGIGALILVASVAVVIVGSRGGADPFGVGERQVVCSSAPRIFELVVLAPLFEELLPEVRSSVCNSLAP